MRELSADVVVIGGGPAGCTAAILLAEQGHRVVLLEKEQFPREHVGESLLPFCHGLFQRLGMLPEMERRFVRKPGVRFVSEDGRLFTNWCFSHIIHDPSYLSFQVARSEFDAVLLARARQVGVTVHERTVATAVDLEAAGADGGVVVEAAPAPPAAAERNGAVGDDETGAAAGGAAGGARLRARFLLDASGRAAFLAGRLGSRQPHQGLERTALWSHWTGVRRLTGGLEEGMSVIVYLGGGKRGWIWVFPLAGGRLTVGVVIDNAYLRQERRRAGGGAGAAGGDGGDGERGGAWRERFYRAELAQSSFVKELLDGARLAMPVRVEGDYSYFSTVKRGANFALVGDASQFIDPIFSSGIFLSMKSSALVSAALGELLRGSPAAAEEAMAAAYRQIDGAYRLVHRLILLYYNPHAISFAAARPVLELDHKRHESALAAGHYLLAGDFFEHHERYHEFFDLLADPHLFGSYKNLVIDRPEFQESSCGARPEEVFPAVPAARPA